ncbi:DUF2061 domain-containing protein [Candidatus Woesearchaeota archaeon]|jgi:uncharacterized membrane protein|nr:DUF2061 domain-containing protein [Candidatus Woesearchaeota archaeon]
MESHKRTIYKTLTWRVVATTTTVASIYYMTGDWSMALSSGLLANAFKTVFYYAHERAWNKSDVGRKLHPHIVSALPQE